MRPSTRWLHSFLAILTLLIVGGWGSVSAGEESPAVDFNGEVRPILAKRCYSCHGRDAAHREAGLRLDVREGAVAVLESGARAIARGKAAGSELIRRVTTTDGDVRMPPEGEGEPLSSKEIELLRRWIDGGAEYARHWSFVKPRRWPTPTVNRSDWPRQPMDQLILARMEAHGLAPSGEADRHALLRRLSLDLRGLPPSLQEIEAFVNDRRANAYERLVDRLLADSAFGERWARMWLDLARYADSKGYGSDPLRIIWRYLDWVVEAFNRNQPFDQFTIEQLAGDLLPEPTMSQKIATAFHRNTMSNTEGGTDDEEFRVAAVRDRVDTTMQVWMGLTMGCAKCHSHKYDPISQREYYQFYAFFNQTADADRNDESPTLQAPTADSRAALRRHNGRLAKAGKQFETPTPRLAAAQEKWEAGLRPAPVWQVLRPTELKSAAGATLRRLEDGSVLAEGPTADQDEYTVVATTDFRGVTAFRLEVLPDASLPHGGSGRGSDGGFVLSKFTVTAQGAAGATSNSQTTVPTAPTGRAAVALKQASADFSAKGLAVTELVSNGKKPKGQPKGWSVTPQQKKPHQALFILAKPLPFSKATGTGSSPTTKLTFRLDHRSGKPKQLLGRFRLSASTNGNVAPRAVVPADMLVIVDTPPKRRSKAQRAKLAAYYRGIAPELKPLREEIARLKKSRPKVPTVPVMQELAADARRSTHIMVKGNFLTHGEEVQPAMPASFHAVPPGAPQSRLGVAQWLVDPENPLTARVTVNRFWSQLFGIGLVETEEDFGTQGEPPSHPKLLDHLALEFVDSGWDVKSLLRRIVTSATYRQASHVTAEHLRKDPRNRWLARGPRFRLEAEMVRDQALALAGLLSRKTYGPSVYPPQPAGLWQAAFNGRDRQWPTSGGEDRYRRGIYTFWRRTVPYPSMATFDAPSRELCSVRRIRTNTPLQALVTLNDPVYVEAAQGLARRILREGGSTPRLRAAFALRLCLARPPRPEQIRVVVALYQSQLQHYLKHDKAAGQIATDPLGPLPSGMTTSEAAAWTTVANVLLNLDGVLSKG